MRRLISLLGNLRRRRNIELEIDDELRFHLQMETEAHRARGLSMEHARRNALRDLGGVTQTREAVRETRTRWIDAARQDLRYAVRRWRHRPGFTAAAVLTVGLGIAAVTSIFSVVDAVLLRPLPWATPESLVIVHGVFPDRRNDPATAPTWNRWYLSLDAWDGLSSASSFEAVGVWHASWASDTIIGDRRDEIVPALNVSAKLLPMLGVKLERGRFFSESEDYSRSDSVIVTDEFWRRRFGGADDIVGKRVTLGQARFPGESSPRTVVGVIAPFQFGGIRAEVIRPIGESRWRRDSAVLRMVARLAPGVSLAQAEAQAAALVSASPIDQQSVSARLVSIEDEHLGSSRRPLWLLFGGAGILLLVACSNVAGLLLGEARIRRHEFGVRAAIGGSRQRILRQLAVEHGLLAVAGATIGLMAARWLTRLVVAAAPAEMPRIEATVIDIRTAAFALAACLVTLLIFGVAPAMALARTPVAGVLGSGTRNSGANKVTGQRLVVAAQVALALVLLTGATLFAETTLRLRALPLGFHPDGVTVVSTTFTGSVYGDPATIQAAWKAAGQNANPGAVLAPLQRATTTARTDAVLQRLSAIPGVTSAAATSSPPFVANPEPVQVILENRPDTERLDASRQVVTDGYFATMGMHVLKGRDFEGTDTDGPAVAVVSSEFESRFFPEGALNRRFTLAPPFARSAPYRVVGVVPDVKRQEPTDDVRPAYYFYDRQGGTPNHFVLRSSGDPTALLSAARRAVNEVSVELVVKSTTTLVSSVERSIVEERFRATLSGIFGAAALVLAAVGLYGLAARRVIDRRREFAVRVALGARPTDVRRLVVWDVVTILSTGFVVGLPTSFAAARIMDGMLFGVSSTSPHVFALTSVLLSMVVMIATLLPARRAGQVDPVAALKE